MLRSFASERGDDWPELVPLVEFAINDSASTLGSGYTPFYADRGQHPRRPLLPTAPSDAAAGDGEAAARLLEQVTGEVRALLQERRIMKTLARYCVCLDEYDIEGVMACFTTDATADYGPGRGGLVRGREAIAARIARGQAAFRRTHHQLGQVAITLRRQTALATTYVTAWHERDDGGSTWG